MHENSLVESLPLDNTRLVEQIGEHGIPGCRPDLVLPAEGHAVSLRSEMELEMKRKEREKKTYSKGYDFERKYVYIFFFFFWLKWVKESIIVS